MGNILNRRTLGDLVRENSNVKESMNTLEITTELENKVYEEMILKHRGERKRGTTLLLHGGVKITLEWT